MGGVVTTADGVTIFSEELFCDSIVEPISPLTTQVIVSVDTFESAICPIGTAGPATTGTITMEFHKPDDAG